MVYNDDEEMKVIKREQNVYILYIQKISSYYLLMIEFHI